MRKYHVDRNHFLFKLSKRATTLEMITMGIIISFVINPIKTPTPFIITFTIIHLHIHRKIQCFFSSIFSFLLYQVKIELFFVWVLFCTDVNFLFLLVVIFLFNSYCGIAFPRRSFLQDNVYMEQGYREASGGSFCMYETKITVWKQKQRTKQPLIYIHRKSFLCFVISQAHNIKNKKREYPKVCVNLQTDVR